MAEEKKTSKKPEAEKTDKAKKKKSKKNPFKSIVTFFKSVKAEGKKVTWAKGKDVVKNTIIVLIVCVIVGVAIFAVDTGLSEVMKLVKNAANTTTTTSQAIDEDDADEADEAEEAEEAEEAPADDTAEATDAE